MFVLGHYPSPPSKWRHCLGKTPFSGSVRWGPAHFLGWRRPPRRVNRWARWRAAADGQPGASNGQLEHSSREQVYEKLFAEVDASRFARVTPRLLAPMRRAAGDATAADEAEADGNVSVSQAHMTLRTFVDYMRVLFRHEPVILRRFILALILMVLTKSILVSVPFLFKRGVDLLSCLGDPATPSGTAAMALYFLVGHGVLRTVANITHELRTAVFIRAGQGIGRQISRATFQHLLELDHSYLLASKVGTITAIVNRGTRSVMTLFRALVLSFVPSLFELVLVCAVMATRLSWHMSLATMAFFVAFVSFTLRVNQRFTPIRRRMNDLDNEASGKAADALMNFDSVKYFDNAAFETVRYDRVLAEYERCAIDNEKMYTFLNAGQASIYNAGHTLVLCSGAARIVQQAMTVGDLVMASALLQQLSFPLQFLGWQARELKAALIDLENLFTLLQQQPTVRDAPDARPLSLRCGGEIRFENVSFAYDKGELASGWPVLRRVSFLVPAGKRVAIVGGSGGGKSTILRLLFRLYDPLEGDIYIDGQNVRQVTQSSLRAVIGFIPQEAALFNDTIFYNIAYGKVHAAADEVVAAARLAKIDATIRAMPQQYDTLVGERGIRLSGGEKQRVAIARAILRNPRILCLDEATSALDSKTEKEITAALDELGQNRTVMMVAHRLATVVNADEILVLDGGRIVERGSHPELLAMRGLYYDMWQRQTERATQEVPSENGQLLEERNGARPTERTVRGEGVGGGHAYLDDRPEARGVSSRAAPRDAEEVR